MNGRPRALHVAPIMPARSGNGLAMRQGMFLEALSRPFETQLVVLPVAGRADEPSTLADSLGVPVTVIPVAGRQDTHFSLLARLADPAARLAAFRSYGRSSLAAQLSAPVLADLKAALRHRRYDLIHVGRSYLADALDALDGARVTMDLDEDEWTSYREVAATLEATDPARADWAEAEGTAMSTLIARSAPRIAHHFISSAYDAELARQRHPELELEVIDNVVEVPADIRRHQDSGTLLFLGSFGYAPNVDAANWFVHDIWPLVRAGAERPVHLLIVGRDAGRVAALGQHPHVEVRGEIEDVAHAYAEASLFIAPLRAGAGTRLKLLEAAAHRVPIVTTSLGARGLSFADGRDVVLADDAASFANAILEALADGAASSRRAEAALAVVRQRYERSRAVEHLACRMHTIAAT